MARTRRFDPEKYYHVTPERNVKDILKNGLIPGSQLKKSPHAMVFLTKGHILPTHEESTNERMRIFEVDPTDLKLTDYSAYRQHPQWVVYRVPPANLRLMRKSRKEPHVKHTEVTKYELQFATEYRLDGSWDSVVTPVREWKETITTVTYYT